MKGDVMDDNAAEQEVKAWLVHLRKIGLSPFSLENFDISSRAKLKESLYICGMGFRRIYDDPRLHTLYAGETLNKATSKLIKDLMNMVWDSEGNIRREDAKHAANVRHSSPGGSREKQEKIRALWASGKYTSRDICAEQECAALGMSFSAARKALRNSPAPT